MTTLKSQSGQSSIEAAVMATLLLGFLVVFFSTVYIIYASYWVEHIMYESLICYQEREQKQFCVDQASVRMHSILMFQKSFNMKMVVVGSITQAEFQLKINPPLLSERTFTFKKELRI
jgi:hypothetical protein